MRKESFLLYYFLRHTLTYEWSFFGGMFFKIKKKHILLTLQHWYQGHPHPDRLNIGYKFGYSWIKAVTLYTPTIKIGDLKRIDKICFVMKVKKNYCFVYN